MPTAVVDAEIDLRAGTSADAAGGSRGASDRLMADFRQGIGAVLRRLRDRVDGLLLIEESAAARRELQRLRDDTDHALATLAEVDERMDLLRYGNLRPDRALRSLAADFARAADVCADVHVRGPIADVPAALRTPLLRLARRALFDVGSHSRASIVVLTLSVEPTRLVLELADDGVDLEQRRAVGRRVAPLDDPLAMLARAVTHAGGRLMVLHGRPRGLRLRAVVPVVAGGTT